MSSTKLNKSDSIINLEEIYIKLKNTLTKAITPETCRKDYVADECWETFLSFEDLSQDVMSAFLIMRHDDLSVPSQTTLICELLVNENIIPLINIYDRDIHNEDLSISLINWAERVAIREHESTKIAVEFTESNKELFQMLGYKFEVGPLLVKNLNPEEYKSSFEYEDDSPLKFDDNQHLICCLDPDVEEEQWIRDFDRRYRPYKNNNWNSD
ncbi:unnamed protein product [Psylliodes chrysocephalus]|uniref:N-acetyltransferase domain-containing protein n=1 Tax=Psylliodes chrysocephalus TaxID=3402493 RepID=A0A9P0GDZ7_9CUCU|nr:unnamed protein product [Psylliodes chrysocephala]